MNLQGVDWMTFLNDDSEMPTDISFKVYDNGSVLTEAGEHLNSEMYKMFRAHKYLLAIVSETFRRQFFGPLAEMSEPVIVEQTSSKAFRIMLDFIYQKGSQFAFPTENFSCLFEVRNLGERFFLAGLVKKTEEEISTRQLSEANLIEAVKAAQNYVHLFPEISNELMVRCNDYFTKNYKTLEKIRKILSDHKDSEIETSLIMMMIRSEPANCPGCKQLASECLDGGKVPENNVQVGVRVIPDTIGIPWTFGIGVITRSHHEDNGWYIQWENGVETGRWNFRNGGYLSHRNGGYFLFKCR